MSISSAPSATARRISARRRVERRQARRKRARDARDAARRCPRPLPRRRRRASGRRTPRRPDGTLGSSGSGRIALPASARTLPGVSAPSSVVRSTHRIARSSAAAFDDVLIERPASDAGARFEHHRVDRRDGDAPAPASSGHGRGSATARRSRRGIVPATLLRARPRSRCEPLGVRAAVSSCAGTTTSK